MIAGIIMCKNKRGFSVFYLLAFVFVSIALIVLLIGCYLYVTHYADKTIQNNISFDSQQWKESILRQQMIADLEENYLHTGMSQSDMISLLGPPDYIYDETQTQDGNIVWEYYLPEGEFDSGDGVLTLRFDDKNLFKSYNVFKERYSL